MIATAYLFDKHVPDNENMFSYAYIMFYQIKLSTEDVFQFLVKTKYLQHNPLPTAMVSL